MSIPLIFYYLINNNRGIITLKRLRMVGLEYQVNKNDHNFLVFILFYPIKFSSSLINRMISQFWVVLPKAKCRG